MKTEMKEVKVSKIKITKMNPRTIVKAELKNSSLRESIKQNGVQHPLEVRKNGVAGYTLLSGERRLTCAKDLKLDKVPVIIYSDMTDAEAYDKMHFENQNREDLTPMEKARDAQNLMQVYKGDVASVAGKLGVTEREARLRVRLNKLSPKMQKKVETDEDLEFLTISHLELIARLDHKTQDGLCFPYYMKNRTLKDFEQHINDSVTRKLELAPFDTAGCEKCEYRSDATEQMGLWTQDKKKKDTSARCLNKKCYEEKMTKAFEALVKGHEEKHGKILILSDDWDIHESLKAKGYEVSYPHSWAPAKKADKGAKAALPFGKKNIKWIKSPSASGEKAPKDENGKAIPKPLKERREQLEGLRVVRTIDSLKDAVRESGIPKGYKLKDLISLCSIMKSTIIDPYIADRQKALADLKAGKKVHISESWEKSKETYSLEEMLWKSVQGDLCSSVSCARGADAIEKKKWINFVVELIAFDMEAAMEQAKIDKPEPKSWATLNPDGSPMKDSAKRKAEKKLAKK